MEQYLCGVKIMEQILQYLDIRNRYLSRLVGGLTHSKRRCGKSGNWTEEDECELINLKSRQKEIQKTLSIISGKGLDGIKNINYYINLTKNNINRINDRKKRSDKNDT